MYRGNHCCTKIDRPRCKVGILERTHLLVLAGAMICLLSANPEGDQKRKSNEEWHVKRNGHSKFYQPSIYGRRSYTLTTQIFQMSVQDGAPATGFSDYRAHQCLASVLESRFIDVRSTSEGSGSKEKAERPQRARKYPSRAHQVGYFCWVYTRCAEEPAGRNSHPGVPESVSNGVFETRADSASEI